MTARTCCFSRHNWAVVRMNSQGIVALCVRPEANPDKIQAWMQAGGEEVPALAEEVNHNFLLAI